jgi:uncharacterized LabA/DUF88 family protein
VGKNVAVFVDVANIFYAAKAAGVDIDYVTLLKSASAGRDLVRAYAYTGLDPDNENQRNFHDFLRRSNYKVVSKDIRKYGDGKIKANLDIELVVDMMKTARNLDIAIVVSGDGDFAPAIRAVQEQGVRVEVISFRGNTSSDLIEVADQFTDIIQLARVERGSRSGRRVAEGDDLSMTEVPDKETEGTGARRGVRGTRGRGRGRTDEVAAAPSRGGRGGRGGRTAAPATDGAGLVALPGERLSRSSGSLTEADLAAAEVFTLDDLDATAVSEGDAPETVAGQGDETADGGRRRRRRGGRGRGRGRGRDDVAVESGSNGVPSGIAADADTDLDVDLEAEEELDDEPQPVAPRGPRTTPFGSVWDSQLGTPVSPAASGLVPLADDDDLDEPEIPEYLIAEQRRGQAGQGARGGRGGRGGGPRGGRTAYQSAMERERYGRGGGGGINRYPDVSGRTGGGSPPAEPRDRSYGRDRDRGRDAGRPARDERPRESAPRSSNEPWSEVPPEVEAMLRAQVASKPTAPAVAPVPELEPVVTDAAIPEPEAKPKRRTTRSTKAAAAEPETPVSDAVDVQPEAEAKPKRRTTRATKAAAPEPTTGDEASATPDADAKPKRRTTKAKAASEPAATPSDADASEPEAKPKRRTTRTKATATDAG